MAEIKKEEPKKIDMEVDTDGGSSSATAANSVMNMKRKREERIDTVEYEFCDAEGTEVSFPAFKVPKGATGATVKISWNF